MIRKRNVEQDSSDDEQQINRNLAKRTKRLNIKRFPDDSMSELQLDDSDGGLVCINLPLFTFDSV